jgi:hypothetical protein
MKGVLIRTLMNEYELSKAGGYLFLTEQRRIKSSAK